MWKGVALQMNSSIQAKIYKKVSQGGTHSG